MILLLLESAPVQSWNVNEIEVPEGTRRAEALETVDGARAIIIRLTPGEELGEHQVLRREVGGEWAIVDEAAG